MRRTISTTKSTVTTRAETIALSWRHVLLARQFTDPCTKPRAYFLFLENDSSAFPGIGALIRTRACPMPVAAVSDNGGCPILLRDPTHESQLRVEV